VVDYFPEKKKVEAEYRGKIEKGTILCIYEFSYHLPARPLTIILVKDSKMNQSQLYKIMQATFTKPGSLAIVGSENDLEKVKSNFKFPPKSILGKFIEFGTDSGEDSSIDFTDYSRDSAAAEENLQISSKLSESKEEPKTSLSIDDDEYEDEELSTVVQLD
jgi:hypothetical protein